jgi:hypothetical protein
MRIGVKFIAPMLATGAAAAAVVAICATPTAAGQPAQPTPTPATGHGHGACSRPGGQPVVHLLGHLDQMPEVR